MLNVLKNFNLTVVETHGFKVDFEKYDIVDFTNIESTDTFHVTLRKVVSAEEYVTALLKRGYGIFLGDKVYYSVNLIPDVINSKKKSFEEYILNEYKLSKLDRYNIQKYLIHPKYEIFVKNAMYFYKLDFDKDFIRTRLKGRVKDVDKFMSHMEDLKNNQKLNPYNI